MSGLREQPGRLSNRVEGDSEDGVTLWLRIYLSVHREGVSRRKGSSFEIVDEGLSNCDPAVGYWLPNMHIHLEPKEATLFGGRVFEEVEEPRKDILLGYIIERS